MRLRLAAATLLTLGTIAGTAGTAQADNGCGPGYYRGYSGWCKPHSRGYGYGPGYYARPMVYGYGYGWRRPPGRHGWRDNYGGWNRRW